MRQTTIVLLALYGLVVAFVVAWPTPVDDGSHGLIFRVLGVLHRNGFPEFVNYNVMEFTANVAMFVPLGLLIALLFGPRWWWAAILICVGLSASIELYQYLLLPDRYATLRDVVANSTGGASGAFLAVLPMAWLRRGLPPLQNSQPTQV